MKFQGDPSFMMLNVIQNFFILHLNNVIFFIFTVSIILNERNILYKVYYITVDHSTMKRDKRQFSSDMDTLLTITDQSKNIKQLNTLYV